MISDIDTIDYASLETDNIGIGINIGNAYRLGSGQQSVVSIMFWGKTTISVSVSVSVSHIG
jgi:hypothetical protein